MDWRDPGLSAEERERLELLAEEAGEVVKAAMKVLRHGYNSFNPFDVGAGTNRSQLQQELGDLGAVVQLMVKRGDVYDETIRDAMAAKRQSAEPYLHFNTFVDVP